MHVIIIGPAYPLRGGLASYNERLAREFQREGNTVTIYTFSLQYPKLLFPGTTQYSTESAPTDLSIKVKINSVNPLNWLKTGKEIANLQPNLVVIRYWLPFMAPCLGTIARIIKKNKKTKIICIADNVIPHEKRPGDKPFTRYFIKPIDAFITMSEKVMHDLKEITQKPAHFVTHPLYDNFGEPINQTAAKKYLGIADNINIVLFFGFIRQYKGLDLLLEAIYILKEKNAAILKNTKFLIAGEFYEDNKPYLEQIDKYKIEEYLILKTKFIADSDVKYYLCAADCVIQPYRSATQSGVTPLAYHFNIPMIVTNVGGLPSLVPDNVGLICECTPVKIAEAIETFFKKDVDLLKKGIQQEKIKYSWGKMTKAISEMAF